MNRLRELRQEDGLSLGQLARRLGVHESTISRWETQAGGIPDERKRELAEHFGVSVSFLMRWPERTETRGELDDDNGDFMAKTSWVREVFRQALANFASDATMQGSPCPEREAPQREDASPGAGQPARRLP